MTLTSLPVGPVSLPVGPVSLALVMVVLWGSLIGSLLPLILRRLGFDPATSSAPFVATLRLQQRTRFRRSTHLSDFT